MTGLVKAKKYDIEDSNIALLGSDLEKNVRLNAAQKEEAWKTAGKQLGLEIWRIEQFKVVAWPKEHYGKFYSGDSYIVMHTYKKTPDDKKFSFDIHFWLGKETTQDEAGTAAYKTVELDDFLGGAPVQHREVQGHESPKFLAYFPKFFVQEGGIATGFRRVKVEEYRHRLLQVKGMKKTIVVREVPKTYKSMNSGDVFILDCGLKVYQFIGKDSSGIERHKAAEFSRSIDDERKGLAKILVVNETDADLDEFWTALGDRGQLKSSTQGDEEAKVQAAKNERALYRLSDSSGKMVFTQESKGTVRRSMFDTNDVFIFDAGMEIFVWCGRQSNAEEKRMAMQYAQNYLHENKRPAHLPISRIMENGENEAFNSLLDPEDGKRAFVIQKSDPKQQKEPSKWTVAPLVQKK